MEQFLSDFFAGGLGSGVVVWFVLRIKFLSMQKEVDEVKKTAVRAHSRIDTHLQGHN